jgi:hypothetical protein
VEIGIHHETQETAILGEKGILKAAIADSPAQRTLFPQQPPDLDSIMTAKGGKGTRRS